MDTKALTGGPTAEGTAMTRPRGAGAGAARSPAEFVYDNGQIILELLRGRAAEEERWRFVEGLRRLGRAADAKD
jgi:hypothetical protein